MENIQNIQKEILALRAKAWEVALATAKAECPKTYGALVRHRFFGRVLRPNRKCGKRMFLWKKDRILRTKPRVLLLVWE